MPPNIVIPTVSLLAAPGPVPIINGKTPNIVETIESLYNKMRNLIRESYVGRTIEPILNRIDNVYVGIKNKFKKMIMNQLQSIVMENVKHIGPLIGNMMIGNMAGEMGNRTSRTTRAKRIYKREK